MWYFNNKIYDGEFNKDFEGFVYLIIDKETNKRYIGKKFLHSIRKVKGKSRRQRKESDWRKYWSSSKEIQKLVKESGEDRFERHIIVFCKTRGDCNRLETYLLWKNNVLENDEYYNDSIGNMRTSSNNIMSERKWCENEIGN